MLTMLDVYERAVKGPIMAEKDFDLKVFTPQLMEITKKYDIRYDKDNPVPADDEAADNLFEAAVEFLTRVGVYCQGTNRVMQFSEDEIRQALREAPGKCFPGAGKDAGVMGLRKPDENKYPWFHCGTGIAFSSEEAMTNMVEGCASISGIDSISFPALEFIRGLPSVGGTPAEFYAAIRGVNIGMQALKRAGRPGLSVMNLISTAATAQSAMAASAPQFGCRTTDGWLCGAVAEFKLDLGVMTKIAYLKSSGCLVGAETAPILGGYCGGPNSTAVASTAYIIMGVLVYNANYQLHFPVHFKYGCTTTQDVLWTCSISAQAASRNIPMPVIWDPYCAAGPNTKMYMYEAAAYILSVVASGGPSFETCHPAKGVLVDGFTPMDVKWNVEMGKAASRLTRPQANEIVKQLLEKYESRLGEPPRGNTYLECYDTTTGKPSDDYVRLYDEVEEELTGMGVPLD
ncbi:MAG: monomethylamine:corrinoid methyltransferase [Thermodesulfobacteriota bacterium]